MMLLLTSAEVAISHEQLAALLGGILLLILAVLALLTWTVRNLTSTSRALKLHADVNSSLNDELRQSYTERRDLREKNEALAERVDDLEATARLQHERLLGLQSDKARLKDELAAMHAQSEQRDRTHREVVDALTGQIAQLKFALQTEQDARQRGEQALRQQIEQLTTQNKTLAQAASTGATSNSGPSDEISEPNTTEEGKQS